MSDIDALQALTSQMTQEGIRRLLVISGDAAWCRKRAEAIRAALPGDWLWVASIHGKDKMASKTAGAVAKAAFADRGRESV
ncbi:hypothetical protein HIN55_09460 [Salmonella enterica subsp. enterica serovar Typhimurium]|nr:hypothetical protein [Salmonella enterica subsp. enterica serovar Typhimurium]